MGAEEHPKIVRELGGAYKAIPLDAYVRKIGTKLASVSEMPNVPWHFTVLNDPQVNAFALPGGYVYITRGLLALAENEAEMASVLAHEIGHVTARHAAQRYSTTMATQIGLTGLGILGSVFGMPNGLGRIVSTGAQVALQQYSQSQELEADMLSVRYLIRAGYDPNAMTSFFWKLKLHSELAAREQGKDGVNHNIMSTHPRTKDRISQAIEVSKIKNLKNPIVRRNEYLKRIDGMVFGDDPKQGIRKGREFLHPELRIAFTVPPKFILFNSPRQVVAFGPKKSRIVFDVTNQKEAKKIDNLAHYIHSVWGRRLGITTTEKLNINGMEAAMGIAKVGKGSNARDVRLVVARASSKHIFRMAFILTPSEAHRLNLALRRTTYSLRRLSPAEAGAIRPLRLKVQKVQTGDSIAKLARRLPLERFKREWFRLLNSLSIGQKLIRGHSVKMVVE